MKIILEKWQHFLNEEVEEELPFRVYCDMDGVLVDLPGGILQTLNVENTSREFKKATLELIVQSKREGKLWQHFKNNERYNKSVKYIFQLLTDNEEFWANLPPTEDAMVLWSGLQKYNPFILSAPWRSGGKVDQACVAGKNAWLKKLDPSLFKGGEQRVFLENKKEIYASNDGAAGPNILIDDMPKYRLPWEANGGIAIAHQEGQAGQTLEKLASLINKISVV